MADPYGRHPGLQAYYRLDKSRAKEQQFRYSGSIYLVELFEVWLYFIILNYIIVKSVIILN